VAGAFGRSFFLVSFLFSVISLASFIDAWLKLGLLGFIGKVIASYRSFLEFFLGWMDPHLRSFAHYIGALFQIDVQYYPHWKDILVPASLYLTRVAQVSWRMGRKRVAVAYAAWGVAVALALSLASGAVALDDRYLRTLLFPILGFVAYEIGACFLAAVMVGFEHDPWWRVFLFHLRMRVVTIIVIGAAVIFFAFRIVEDAPPGSTVLFIVAFVASLALRDIGVSIWVAIFRPRQEGQTRLEKLGSQANFWVGCTTLSIILAAVAVILLNGGS
jgi:hypothetical protein